MESHESTEFGMLAIGMGFLTRTQVRVLVDEQRRMRERGRGKRIGELCLEHRLLTREQVLLVLRAQGKRILSCSHCQKSYNVHAATDGESYLCKHCGRPLSQPTGRFHVRVVDSIEPEEDQVKTRPLPRESAGEVDLELRNLLPGYEIVSLSGQGGMGAVYRARDLILNRDVAVKILAPDLTQDREYVERFIREARVAQKLRHPNIVEAYDCGVAGKSIFFLMEYVEGETLEAILEKGKRLSEMRALHYARQTAEALDYAWSRKVLHRDIKPQNLLIRHDGVVKICDLGLSKQYGADLTLTMTGQINCTPAYASPEQGRGLRDLDCRSDVYSLGCTLYQMLTGEFPFVGEGPGDLILKHSTEPRPDAHERIRAVSRPTADLVRSMMAIDPEERPMPGEAAKAMWRLIGNRTTSNLR